MNVDTLHALAMMFLATSLFCLGLFFLTWPRGKRCGAASSCR